jgi:hypothetical protein
MPHYFGFGLYSRIATGAFLAASLSSCANSVRVAGFGDLPTADQVPGYRVTTIADRKGDQPKDLLARALSNALARKGLVADPNSEQSIEVGFAIRSPRISVENGMATGRAFRPFCQRQLYVLSLVASDRRSGAILAERQASSMRCSWTTPEAITRLADAAIDQPLRPKFRTAPLQGPSAGK